MPYYYGYGFDWTIILLIPAMLLSLYAQFRVSGTYKRYSSVVGLKGYTGAEAAKLILEASGIYDVQIEHVRGNLTDHYDPRDRVLRLSEPVYGSRSLAAVGVAAHETGHAIQHQMGYGPLAIRNGIFPIVNFGSRISTPLIFIGLLLTAGSSASSLGLFLLDIGILAFTLVVAFQIITLPVEFNASSRAMEMLEENHILESDELMPAKKVLNAAALTYVAAVITAVANLLRMLLLANRRRD